MNKKLIALFVFCLLLFPNIRAQTIEETVEYINDMSLAHFDDIMWKFPHVASLTNKIDEDGERITVLSQDIEYLKNYTRVEVSDNGVLSIKCLRDIYIVPAGTRSDPDNDYANDLTFRELKTKGKVECHRRMYLKQMDSVFIYGQDPKWSDYNSYCNVFIRCGDSIDCIECIDINTQGSAFPFTIHGYDYALRVKKALEHLIKLAKENPDYWEKDPFG